jgi:hypothetical protein
VFSNSLHFPLNFQQFQIPQTLLKMFWNDLLAFVWRPWPLFIWILALAGFLIQIRLCLVCLGIFKTRTPRLSHNLQINIFFWFAYSFAIILYQSYLFSTVDPMTRSGESSWGFAGQKLQEKIHLKWKILWGEICIVEEI